MSVDETLSVVFRVYSLQRKGSAVRPEVPPRAMITKQARK